MWFSSILRNELRRHILNCKMNRLKNIAFSNFVRSFSWISLKYVLFSNTFVKFYLIYPSILIQLLILIISLDMVRLTINWSLHHTDIYRYSLMSDLVL